MSLILGYANKTNAIIMSDGRAGENGCVSEHYNKTMKINDNIIIGFAGIKERIEFFVQHVIKQMGSERNDYFIDDFLELIDFLMQDKDTQIHLQSSFIIIGRNKNKQIITTIAGNSAHYKMEKYIVTNVRHLAIGGTIDGEKIFEIYKKNLSNYDMSIQDCMIKTIHDVSFLDSSVNTNTFGVAI